MTPALYVHLQAGYGEQAVLSKVQFEIAPGERLGLLGSSGAGKSTLLFALLGLLPLRGGWAKGEVLIEGRNLLALPKREARKMRGRAISLVPQSPLSALNPALSIGKHFEQYWKAHRSSHGNELQERMRSILERVQLPASADFLSRRPNQISVGQAQRCTLALALLHRPSVIIADEPTSSLDAVTQTEVLDLLREVSEEQNSAVLFVSHDLLSVLRLCSSIAVLDTGRIAEQLATEHVPLAQSRALRELLRALPVPAKVILEHMRVPQKGQVNRADLLERTATAQCV